MLYGFYGENNDKFSTALFTAGVRSSELTNWGFGAVQEIDAAAMSLWIHYQKNDFEAENAAGADFFAAQGGLEDFDAVKAGALINF